MFIFVLYVHSQKPYITSTLVCIIHTQDSLFTQRLSEVSAQCDNSPSVSEQEAVQASGGQLGKKNCSD